MINISLVALPCGITTLCGISTSFPVLFRNHRQVAHALLTRPPLSIAASFDLNVLCTPPAFILSQDQTLHKRVLCSHSPVGLFITLFVC
jgi:hypothetical protein